MFCHDVRYFFWEDTPSKDFYLISYEIDDNLHDKHVYTKTKIDQYKKYKKMLNSSTFRWSYTKVDADIVQE